MGFREWVSNEKRLLSFPPAPHGPLGMIYPNVYAVGMASLGFQQIYRLFMENGVSAERVFLDKKGRETRSLENGTPLFRFPVLAASYSFELDVLNLIQMLDRGGVNPLAENRREGEPALIMGGMAVSSNPRLLQRIADAMVLGEGETVVESIAKAIADCRNRPKSKLLEALADLPHVYVPAVHGNHNPVLHTRHALERLDDYPCHTAVLAKDDHFGGSFLLEMSRGCTYRCKFCIVHYMNGRGRYRDFGKQIAILDRFKDHYRKVGLLGAAVADHPQVEETAEWLVRNGKQVSTSSLRAEKLTENLLDLLRDGGQHTITVAPETGSTESRRRMRKGVKDEHYHRLAEWAGKRRFPNLKLYFLIGTPESNPCDEATEIISFCQAVHDIFTQNGGGRLTATVSPFVPKPTTPWEGEAMWDPKEVKKASRIIRKHLAFRGSIKTPAVNVKEARAETVLTWAGPEVTDDLLRIARGEIPLEAAFKNFDLSQYTAARLEAAG